MTKLIDEAVAAVKQLPAKTQDDIARLMLNIAHSPVLELSADVKAALAESDAQFARGERVPESVIKNFWQSQGL
jgi:hypothetical protein